MSTDQKDNILDIENISNADIKAKWGLPDDIDPYSVDIDKINPANNDWFGKNLRIVKQVLIGLSQDMKM